MDPATAMLMALQLAMGAQASANATGSAQQNLQFQKDQAAKSDRMAGATKVDAYGNKQVYDPATNTFSTELTPMQKAIQQAGESEQYKTLGVDAQRKRNLAQRQEQYSQDASKPYSDAVTKYIYQQPHTEAALNDEIGTLMTQAKQNEAKSNQGTLTREALRLGRGADIPALIKSTNDTLGASTPSTMLAARQQALQEHGQRQQAHDTQFLPQIQAFKQIIGQGGGGADARFSDLPGQVAASQSASQQGMLSALASANSGINSASKTLVGAEGKAPDFTKLIAALKPGKTEQWDKSPAKVDYSTTPDYLDDITYGRTDSSGFPF